MGDPQRWLKIGYVVMVILVIIPVHGLNLGLIAGDNKRLSSPLLIKRVSKLSPVFININGGQKIGKSLLPIPKLPPKPPPLKLTKANVPKLKRSLLSPSLISPMLPPLPILPILPILPPFLPPILPLLPRLPLIPPLPILPRVPSLSRLNDPLKPLRVPILSKPPFSLDSKTNSLSSKGNVLAKLIDLRLKGSLTTEEFVKFRKLLVKS